MGLDFIKVVNNCLVFFVKHLLSLEKIQSRIKKAANIISQLSSKAWHNSHPYTVHFNLFFCCLFVGACFVNQLNKI